MANYTLNGKPGTPTLYPDLKREESITTDAAYEYVNVKWTAPPLGENNGVVSYNVHVGVWGRPDGTTVGRKSYLYAVGIIGTQLNIYRSTLRDKIGVDANTQVTQSAEATRYWNCIDVQIQAIDKYGNSTYSDIPTWQCYWNEMPTRPTDIEITGRVEGIGANLVNMKNYSEATVQAHGSIDRWIPSLDTNYNVANTTSAKYYQYVATKSASTPTNDIFSKGVTSLASSTVKLSQLLGDAPELGTGEYYIHARAFDGQVYSKSIYAPLMLGVTLEADDNLKFTSPFDGFDQLNPFLILVLPALHVDDVKKEGSESFKYYPPDSVYMTAHISVRHQDKTDAEWLHLYDTSFAAPQAGENISIPLSSFWETMVTKLGVDLSGKSTSVIKPWFRIEIECEKESRLHATIYAPVSGEDNIVIKSPAINAGLVSTDIINGEIKDLFYLYGQVSPYVTDNVVVQLTVEDLPTEVYVNYSIDYALLGTSDSPVDSSVTWSPLTTGVVTNQTDSTKPYQIILSVGSLLNNGAIKLRIRIMDFYGNANYKTLYWPMPDVVEDNKRIQYASITHFEPKGFSITDMSSDTIIAKQRRSQNEITISYGIKNDKLQQPEELLYVRPYTIYGRNLEKIWSPDSKFGWELYPFAKYTDQIIYNLYMTFDNAKQMGQAVYFPIKGLELSKINSAGAKETIVNFESFAESEEYAYPVNKDMEELILTIEARIPLSTVPGWTASTENINLSLSNTIYAGYNVLIYYLNSKCEVDTVDWSLKNSTVERSAK